MAQIILDRVTYRYPKADYDAVSDVSAKFASGRFVVIYGGNGSGKSTLARIVAGLIIPDKGRVIYENFNSEIGWNGVGILMQNVGEQLLAPSVEREIAFGPENLGWRLPQIETTVEELLVKFDLNRVRYRQPEHLSDGEKQLTALAALIAMNPTALILDEATAYLDPDWSLRIREIVKEESRRRAVIWLTTRTAEMAAGDEVWRMDSGRLLAFDR